MKPIIFKEGKTKSEFLAPEVGTHTASFVGLVDLGTQPEATISAGKYAGKVIPAGPRQLLFFEILESPQTDGRPTLLHKEIKSSAHPESTSFAIARALSGLSSSALENLARTEGLALQSFLGKGLLVSVGRSAGGSATLTSFSALMKGQKVSEAETDLFHFDIDSPNTEVYNSLYDWVKAKIDASEENPVAGSAGDSKATSKFSNLDL